MSLLAWKHDPQDAEAGCRIVFAPTPEHAAEVASVEMCGSGGEVTTNDITRAPEFDCYAGRGQVPDSALLAAGWRVSCSGPFCDCVFGPNGCEACAGPEGSAYIVTPLGAFCSEACLPRRSS